jgi:hypothetical protein
MRIEPNSQYAATLPEITKNRDCVEGSARIKSKTNTYLKHPGIYENSLQEQTRYNAYIDGAEFHEFPGETLSALLGKLSFGDTEVELPPDLDYLIDNVDGDGMSLKGLLEDTASNVLQAKYHILLTELPNTVGLDTENVSKADAEELDIKAYIRQYNRESLIDWQFDYYDNVKQLTLLIFREDVQKRNEDLKISTEVSYLVCGLDDIGYYQARFIEQQKGAIIQTTGRIYPQVSGSPLSWIPVEIVSDQELPSGSLPRSGGYLSAVCNAALSRYRVSADYKEALRNGVPTLFTKGWMDGDIDLFRTINGGRSTVVTGAGVVNNLPNQVEVMVEGVALNDEPFINYFENNAKMARALGAKFSDTETMASTATEANINASNNNAILENLATNEEAAFIRSILYCGMFNGLWDSESIEENAESIILKIPREFSSSKMTPDEARATKDLWRDRLMSTETAITKLVQGGFTPIAAEEEIRRIESQAPLPENATTEPTIDNNQNSV